MARCLTLVLAGSQQVDDIGMVAQLAKNFQLSSKVPVVILRGKFCGGKNICCTCGQAQLFGVLHACYKYICILNVIGNEHSCTHMSQFYNHT